MAIGQIPFKTGVFYVLLSGVVMFLAIFLGIRTGLAVKGDQFGDLTPKTVGNQTSLKLGQTLPATAIRAADGRELTLREISGGKQTLIAVVMPGCGPCKKLLTGWQTKGIVGTDDRQVVLLAAVTPGNLDLGELSEFKDKYTVYFCDFVKLDDDCGVNSFPSLIGVGKDNTIKFVANSFIHQLDNKFFDKYL